MDAPESSEIKEPYKTVEYGTVPIPLSELLVGDRIDMYESVTNKGYLRATLVDDQLRFQAGGYVGLIPINDRVVIYVRPRVPVRNLEKIFIISGQDLSLIPIFARDYRFHNESHPALLDVLTDTLLDTLKPFFVMGLMKGYVAVRDETSFPMGRILVDQTIRAHRSRNVKHKLSTVRFEHTPDIAVNQCIKRALDFLARTYNAMPDRTGRKARLRQLNATYHIFDQVTLDLQQRFFADPLVDGSRALPDGRDYYRNSLRLCTAILRNKGLAFLDLGLDVELPPLVISMEDVFEDFLLAVLGRRISRSDAKLTVLDGSKRGPGGGKKSLFDDAADPEAEPDIVIQRRDRQGSIPVVIDAKYKTDYKREDINQVVTYGASYRAQHVVLALPKAKKQVSGLECIGTIDDLRIYAYRFDLAAEDLDHEIDLFAESMRDLADPDTTRE